MTQTIEGLETITFEQVVPYEEDKEEDGGLCHIVSPPENTHIWDPGMSAQEIVDIARMNGMQVVALCGHTWVPKKDPAKKPVCKQCLMIAQLLIVVNE